MLYSCKTRTGGAIHARHAGAAKTLCGRRAAKLAGAWQVRGRINHPLACERCDAAIRRGA